LIDAPHPLLNHVIIDDVAGGRLATQHLIDLGHTKVGFVGDRRTRLFNTFYSQDRYEGYRQALTQAGLPVMPEYYRQREHGREPAREMCQKLMELPDPPTAIVSASDVQAVGVIEGVREFGLRVPEDVSVIGYDDIEIAEYLNLTTIRQHLFASGVEGVRLLLEAIASTSSPPRRVLLPVELIVRDTTAPPGSG
jgi:LacI family transcriptional regulator